MHVVYFLESLKNGKIYIGVTEKDPDIRLQEHNSGTNQWTRQNGPFEMLYYERYFCKVDAQNREKFYKSGVGREIKKAIALSVKNK